MRSTNMRLRIFADHWLDVAKGLALLAAMCVFLLQAAAVSAADPPRGKAVGPENHVILSDTLSGSYFVAAPLKERYDRLLSQLEALKCELDAERVTGPQAATRLTSLRDELRKLREDIDRSKV